jgi:hypothetical protein
MKKKWTKEEFIEECNRKMANITDPKRRAALRCKRGARKYKARELKAKTKTRRPRDA